MSLSRSILMIINLLLGVCRAQNPATCPLNREHDAYAGNVQKLADDKTQYLASLNNNEAFLSLLHPIMIRRVPGTTNHALVRKHIIDTLESYEWTVETDDFTSKIPYVDEDMNGQVPFSNIIATWDPRASRRLILACHYDSLYQNRHSNFIGATDSAVPCAILLDVARTLTPYLRQQQEQGRLDVTLQLVFFDGEEAFKSWSSTDSLYGARHLAAAWANTPHPRTPGCSQLDGINMLVLLDLLGTEMGCTFCPQLYDWQSNTRVWYGNMVAIEDRLERLNLLDKHSGKGSYFKPKADYSFGAGLQDDHVPFLQRGVKIVHLIPRPFPSVWHQEKDNYSALHGPTIGNLLKIFRIFTAEYLQLPI